MLFELLGELILLIILGDLILPIVLGDLILLILLGDCINKSTLLTDLFLDFAFLNI